jgi:hypothetical protein
MNYWEEIDGVDEDLARKQIVRNRAEAVHGHRLNDQVSVTGDVSGCDSPGARGEHLHNQFDAVSGT